MGLTVRLWVMPPVGRLPPQGVDVQRGSPSIGVVADGTHSRLVPAYPAGRPAALWSSRILLSLAESPTPLLGAHTGFLGSSCRWSKESTSYSFISRDEISCPPFHQRPLLRPHSHVSSV